MKMLFSILIMLLFVSCSQYDYDGQNSNHTLIIEKVILGTDDYSIYEVKDISDGYYGSFTIRDDVGKFTVGDTLGFCKWRIYDRP